MWQLRHGTAGNVDLALGTITHVTCSAALDYHFLVCGSFLLVAYVLSSHLGV